MAGFVNDDEGELAWALRAEADDFDVLDRKPHIVTAEKARYLVLLYRECANRLDPSGQSAPKLKPPEPPPGPRV